MDFREVEFRYNNNVFLLFGYDFRNYLEDTMFALCLKFCGMKIIVIVSIEILLEK